MRRPQTASLCSGNANASTFAYKYRGQHLAQALLEAMENHARARGVRRIYLDSKDDLREALRLYTPARLPTVRTL